jgi:hypothetical protein
MKHDDEDTNANHKLGKIFFSSHLFFLFLASPSTINEREKNNFIRFFPFYSRYCCFGEKYFFRDGGGGVRVENDIYVFSSSSSSKWNKCNFAKHFLLLILFAFIIIESFHLFRDDEENFSDILK